MPRERKAHPINTYFPVYMTGDLKARMKAVAENSTIDWQSQLRLTIITLLLQRE